MDVKRIQSRYAPVRIDATCRALVTRSVRAGKPFPALTTKCVPFFAFPCFASVDDGLRNEFSGSGLSGIFFLMKAIARELDRRLAQLDASIAEQVERLVRDALALASESEKRAAKNGWPDGYFERTAGALAGEILERPQQGDAPEREAW